MDTQWCLTCGRHIEDERDLYCSNQCYREANPSSPSAFHRPSPTLIPSIPSSTDARILAWRSKVAPGAPERLTRPSTPSSRSRHNQSSQYHHHVQRPTIREPSPSSASASSSSTPGRTRPKLVQLATSPVSPSVSLTFSPLQQRDRPPALSPAVPTAISPSSTTGRHYQHHHLTARHDVSRRSSMTCTTAITSDDSVATPLTPTVPLGIPIEPAPTDAYKLSLWKRVRTWVGPTSPPHVAGVDNHFPAFGAHRKHTALYIDEETLERCDSAPLSVDSLDDDDDDSERGSGLAGWFAHRAEEQQRQQQQQQHQQKRQIAFQKREQKLDRAMAQASYYAIR